MITPLPITKKKRIFLPETLDYNSWNNLKPYFEQLQQQEPHNKQELEDWLLSLSELEAVLQEEKAWRFIRLSINNTDEKLNAAFTYYVETLEPHMEPYWDAYRKKIINNPHTKELKGSAYQIYLRGIKRSIELFREENIHLLAAVEKESQEHGKITGSMTVTIDGKELTLQQASNILEEHDRKRREETYHKMQQRRLQDAEKLDKLYTQLVKQRHTIALNAGYQNFRDYKHDALGRFDYSVKDCKQFHQAIAQEVVPLMNHLDNKRKQQLRLTELKPWDLSVDTYTTTPLKPFEGEEELINKTIGIFNQINPYFGRCISTLKTMNYLSLESEKGKRGGGYNYPLHDIGIPFIFTNSSNSHKDVTTMMHEGGHAIHSFLTRELKLTAFKDCPSEVAELASMSMELLTMDYWKEFYPDNKDLKRALRQQLENAIQTLPWVAIIDAFQHWIYEHPDHTEEERTQTWLNLMNTYHNNIINWKGCEHYKEKIWQKQLHLYEVPFYYIEYGMAQLGALALYRNYKKDKKKTIQQYTESLKLGYTKTIPEIYETAGIKFDFSKAYIRELMNFVKEELEKLE